MNDDIDNDIYNHIYEEQYDHSVRAANPLDVMLRYFSTLLTISSILCLFIAMMIFRSTSIQGVLNAIYFVLLSQAIWRMSKFCKSFIG